MSYTCHTSAFVSMDLWGGHVQPRTFEKEQGRVIAFSNKALPLQGLQDMFPELEDLLHKTELFWPFKLERCGLRGVTG